MTLPLELGLDPSDPSRTITFDSDPPPDKPPGVRLCWWWCCSRCKRSYELSVSRRCLHCDRPFDKKLCRNVWFFLWEKDKLCLDEVWNQHFVSEAQMKVIVEYKSRILGATEEGEAPLSAE